MEKREREHQESSAEVTMKHSQELKDLGKKRISVSTVQRQNVYVSAIINQFSLSVYQSIIAELSYSQKLIVEHERHQDLQQKYQRMQEDYETQLKVADESRIQALEELTQLYEAKLQEKTQLLAQVSQQEQRVEEEVGLHMKPVKFLCPL